jgi:hypothetical protein
MKRFRGMIMIVKKNLMSKICDVVSFSLAVRTFVFTVRDLIELK